MTILDGLAILSLLVSMLACLYVDVCDAEHEAFLDELWDDDEEVAA